jgi:hypothetical protein
MKPETIHLERKEELAAALKKYKLVFGYVHYSNDDGQYIELKKSAVLNSNIPKLEDGSIRAFIKNNALYIG